MLAGEIGGAIGGGIQSEGVLAVPSTTWPITSSGCVPAREASRADPLLSTCGCRSARCTRSIWSRSAGPWFGTASLACSARTTASMADTPARTRIYWISRAPSGAGPVSSCRTSCSRFATHGRRLRPDWICPRWAVTLSSPERICWRTRARLDAIALHVLTAVEYVGLKPMQEASPSTAARERIGGEGRCYRRHGAPEERRITAPTAASTRVAVVDAVNVRTVLVVGGAASVSLTDERIESIPEALGKVLASPDQVRVAPAGDGELPLPVISSESAADVIEAVIRDDITGTQLRRTLSRFELRAPEGIGSDWSATVTTTLRAERAGTHRPHTDVRRPSHCVRGRRTARRWISRSIALRHRPGLPASCSGRSRGRASDLRSGRVQHQRRDLHTRNAGSTSSGTRLAPA